MNQSQIILFNGPPRSGKDAIAQELISTALPFHHERRKVKFAEPIRAYICGLLGCTDDEIDDLKDSVIPLFGKTVRQLMIDFSESYMKPTFGDGIFGEILARKIAIDQANGFSCHVVTDSGFQEELEVLADRFQHKSIIVVQLHRRGCSFENDSRDYVSGAGIDHPNMMFYRYENNRSIVDAVNELQNLIWADYLRS